MDILPSCLIDLTPHSAEKLNPLESSGGIFCFRAVHHGSPVGANRTGDWFASNWGVTKAAPTTVV